MLYLSAFQRAPTPARRGLALLADIPDRHRRHGPPEPVVGRRHSWIVSRRQTVPVLPRRRHEIGKPIEELKRREFDNAARAGTPAAAPSSLSISARKIFVSALTAAGRSASMPRNRFGTEITHCRTGIGGMT